jgi:catechol 2,3-dioxygenase-like lactoylglutathione lyase family enzyme
MTIQGFEHVAVYAVNIDESVRFYREAMGFEELRRVPNGDNTLVYMKVTDTSAIELFDYDTPVAYHEHPGGSSGVAHICLGVAGIEAWNERLISYGVEFTLPLCALAHLGKKVLLFKDPNGVVIELCEDI